jgi:bacterioferritin-associated ferredoxin
MVLHDEFTILLEGRDLMRAWVENGRMSYQVSGCDSLMKLSADLKAKHGSEPSKWALPQGDSHAELLVREFILRCQGRWTTVYKHEELCHCRQIKAITVDQAIISGAHTPEQVSRLTTASTACGTCRPDVEKMINQRLRVS